MGQEIDLMARYPRTQRDVHERAQERTEDDRRVAREFDQAFFDGPRRCGYGGFRYSPKFWQPVIPAFQERYRLSSISRILDVGCAKGFMLYDFTQLIAGISVHGIDISRYAIAYAKEEIRDYVQVADARDLPFEDNSFDLVISIATLHNLSREDCKKALSELERVSRKDKFITVDAYHNEAEKERMDMWNLTALTYMHTEEWKQFFKNSGYAGDYYWFIP